MALQWNLYEPSHLIRSDHLMKWVEHFQGLFMQNVDLHTTGNTRVINKCRTNPSWKEPRQRLLVKGSCWSEKRFQGSRSNKRLICQLSIRVCNAAHRVKIMRTESLPACPQYQKIIVPDTVSLGNSCVWHAPKKTTHVSGLARLVKLQILPYGFFAIIWCCIVRG